MIDYEERTAVVGRSTGLSMYMWCLQNTQQQRQQCRLCRARPNMLLLKGEPVFLGFGPIKEEKCQSLALKPK